MTRSNKSRVLLVVTDGLGYSPDRVAELTDNPVGGLTAAETSSLGRERRYVPWAAGVPRWSETVNANIAYPTHASGKWVGYEDIDPPVQGNSETGHQQIGNLALAPQISLEISNSITSGKFHSNTALNEAITETLDSGGNVNICFLASGLTGSDGRVHSVWSHLEAMLELLFTRRNVHPDRVRIQAILDGRDAPAHGSLRLDGVVSDGYLGELERLLSRYGTEESLAWVVGRGIAMDRDYREELAASNYALLTSGAGTRASSFNEVRAIVAASHAARGTDADVPPIAVAPKDADPRTVSAGDAFINLNFRSDRQRAVTASLAGARDYLRRESAARGRPWSMDWLRDDLDVRICAIAEYDAEFESRYGVSVAFPTKPHALNLLSNWDRLMPEGSTYLLVAESVKASHMGYFIRGRREVPTCPESETRWIIPSTSADEGVMSDSDFYKAPEMRTLQIVKRVSDAVLHEDHSLIVCNLAAPDMIGHLLPERYEEAVVAYRTTCEALVALSEVAGSCGVHMIVTSDHGNIEDDGPTHTANPVLTTIIPAPGSRELVGAAPDVSDIPARLYDIPHTIAYLLGVSPDAVQQLVEESGTIPDDPEHLGRSLVKWVD